MTVYKDDVYTVAHSFNNSTLSLGGEHTVDGLEMIEAVRDNDEVVTQAVASGMAVDVENPIQTGILTIQILESSPSTDWLWDKLEEGAAFDVSFKDSAAPNFNVNAKSCRFVRRPNTGRSNEAQVVEWQLACKYLKMRGGSYRLVSE